MIASKNASIGNCPHSAFSSTIFKTLIAGVVWILLLLQTGTIGAQCTPVSDTLYPSALTLEILPNTSSEPDSVALHLRIKDPSGRYQELYEIEMEIPLGITLETGARIGTKMDNSVLITGGDYTSQAILTNNNQNIRFSFSDLDCVSRDADGWVAEIIIKNDGVEIDRTHLLAPNAGGGVMVEDIGSFKNNSDLQTQSHVSTLKVYQETGGMELSLKVIGMTAPRAIVLDLSGQVIASGIDFEEGRATVDLSGQRGGIYAVSVTDENGQMLTQKVWVNAR